MEEESFNPLVAQPLAIAAFVGILSGALRAKGVLTAQELEDIFQLADQALPARAMEGADILATIRSAAGLVQF